MDYELSDSSGTDDDLPPHQNRFSRGGRTSTNGRPANVGPGSFSRVQTEMETQIHHIEQEAYCSVLRAFKAQSDALTWEKEGLITELRKELRVSDEEHRELLARVNGDDMIRRIREWRKASGIQPGMLSGAQPNIDALPTPSISASFKRQKSSLSVAPSPLGGPSPAFHPPMQPSSSAVKRGSSSAGRGKKHKPYPTTVLTGRTQTANRGSYGGLASNEPAEGATYDPYIGRKVWTRWPEDSHFYEAVITDYDPLQGRHALVYDMNSADETWEWVNLKEISPEDIRWESEEPGVSRKGGRPGSGRGAKKPMTRGGGVSGGGRGRGNTKGPSKSDFPPVQNGIGKKAPGDIELLHTESLIKEVEKIFNASQPDPIEIQKAKRVLKEHEQALVDAIAMLEDTSDGESDGKHKFSRGQSMERD
uniref:ENT domain-containing protein n=1 Tax=Kalanchoe fedtschenkoi TaxID=63787 RepID=A0A7N0T8H0_KALFE